MAESPSKPVEPKAARERLAEGTVIAERYRILETIGAGGMGTVYAAEHLALRKKVAIKVLHLDLLRLPNITARFEREARATARIEHPNVTLALDFGALESGALFLVLEFVDGRRLREEVAQGCMPVPRALNIARQIASLLATAQPLGIVHRDLKPENVILVQRGDENDFVKVMDFGIARMTSPDDDPSQSQPLTKLGAVFGTPEYMAPEQALGQRVDTRADLYSLGVMLFEMLTGVRPYVQTGPTGILSQQITSPRPTFEERSPGIQIPPEVERLVYRLLTKGAQERYQRASDVVAAIEAILTGYEVKKAVPSLPPAAISEPLPSFDLMTKLPGLDTGVPLTESKTAGAETLAQRGAVVSSRLKEQTNQGWHTLRQAAVTWLVHVDRLVVKIKGQLSPALQQRLSVASPQSLRWLLLGATLIVVLLPVVLAVTAVKMSRHRADASVVASAVPSAPVLASAVVPPVPSVQTVVLDENSKDPEVLLALATERLAADKEAEAVSFVVRALTRQPERRNDERVAAVLFRTANSLQRDVSDKTFALLQGTMAGKGAEIQYQIWLDRSVRESTRKRAERWLHSEMFERTAPGAIIIAIRLRQADSCEKKHNLLATAGKIGGPATLSYLTELENEKGCGLDGSLDCYPCLRKDARLKDAAAQIRSRLEAAR